MKMSHFMFAFGKTFAALSCFFCVRIKEEKKPLAVLVD